MKLQKIIFSMVLFSIVTTSQAVIAGGTQSEKIMAKILVHLNHYPSSNEKAQLSNILKQTQSSHEKAVATAILHLEHSARSSDKKELKKVMNDSSVNPPLKDIAGVVYRLNHKPSSSDKKLLTAILD